MNLHSLKFFMRVYFFGDIMSEVKSIKSYAREAKQRMKKGFWENHNKQVADSVEKAEKEGENTSEVVKFYKAQVVETIKGVKQIDEEFYQKVKAILDEVGEVSDILGRLTDKEYFSTLSYEQKQRYLLDLSNNYVKAKERYYKESKFVKI